MIGTDENRNRKELLLGKLIVAEPVKKLPTL
jgi:hypothetical protein